MPPRRDRNAQNPPAIEQRHWSHSRGQLAISNQEERYTEQMMADLQLDGDRGVANRALRFMLGNKKYGQKMTAGLLVIAAGFGVYAHTQDSPAVSQAKCTDAGHDAVKIGDTSHFLGIDKPILAKAWMRETKHVLSLGRIDNDNRTWDAMAAIESKSGQRWWMTGAALAQDNPGLARYDSHKHLIQSISYIGTACIALPAPQIPGVQTVDGKHTVDYYWSDNPRIVSWDEFKVLNPGITGDRSQILQAGKVLLFDKKPASDLMFRTMIESSVGEIAHDNPTEIRHINSSQPAHVGIEQGKPAYLPLLETAYMRKHKITVAAVHKEYAANYVNLGLGQIVPPKDIKPVIPPSAERRKNKASSKVDVSDLQAADLMKSQGGVWVNGAVMMRFYLEHGMTPVQASGLIGNFIGEASNNPQRVQGGPDSSTVPANLCPDRGYGIGQWTSCGRVQGLINFAAEHNMPVGNLMTQLEYSWYELNHGYKDVLQKLLQATTTQQASDIVMGPYIRNGNRSGGYENPNAAVAHQFNRRKFSGQALSLFSQIKNDN